MVKLALHEVDRLQKTQKPRSIRFATFAIVALLASPEAMAQVPERLHYQGVLTLATGEPVECADPARCSQPIEMTFRIQGDPVADQLLWEEDVSDVVVIGGMLNVTLGVTVPLTPEGLQWTGVSRGRSERQ
jgi:hypothetical protein